MRFDIFLPVAPKDTFKIKYVLKAVCRCLEGWERIYVCTPEVLPQSVVKEIHFPVHYRTDMEVLKAEPRKWKYRPNWIYQQMLKLFQNVTKNEWYFVVDCDTILNRRLPIWEKGRPIWYVGWDQNNPSYYRFSDSMIGVGRVYNHTFLADMGFYNKIMINDMLNHFGYTKQSFLEKSYSIVSSNCHPSEADLYMGYMYKYHPGYYIIRELRTKMHAREGIDPFKQLWNSSDIENLTQKMKLRDIDTWSMHSWIDTSHNSWKK